MAGSADVRAQANPWSTRQLVTMALLCSISILLSFIEFPIFPAAPFLKYDAGFVPIMIGGFAYGPGAGFAIGAVQIIIHGLFMADIPGSLMNLLAMTGFVLPASFIYLRIHTRKGAFIGLIVSSICSIALALAGNLIITPWYMGVDTATVVAMILPILLPFNALKAVINSVLTAIVYKGVSNLIKPEKERVSDPDKVARGEEAIETAAKVAIDAAVEAAPSAPVVEATETEEAE